MKQLGTNILETKHLILRPFKESDYIDVYKNYASNDEVTKYVTWSTHQSPLETKAYIESVVKEYTNENYYHWAIELKSNNNVIGAISSVKNDDVSIEIGYCSSIKMWSKGYMTEALVAVMEYCFEEVGFKVMLARHETPNVASGIVMKKAGMKYIGTNNEKGVSLELYKATSEDYKLNRVEYLLNRIHKDTIKNFKYDTFGYQQDYRQNEQICYGYIPFIDSINPNLVVDILPDIYKYNRTGILRHSTEYICIHDTASAAPTATPKAHSAWLHNMSNDPENRNSISWHYTIGDEEIYQHLPLDEVGYHAGDGTREILEFFPTGINATREGKITVQEDGYYYYDGQNTNIKAPLDDKGNIVKNEQLPYNGVCYRIDENGKILVGKTWFSKSYNRIGNRGGNLNTVGIETCVNYGSNYINTMRNTAYIVGKLIDQFDLPVGRVKQHNDFSGKDCPMTIRHAKLWEEFIELVRTEKYRNDYLRDAKFKFESLSKEYLDDKGIIIKYEEGKEISYKVLVEIKDEKYEFVYQSRLGKKEF